MATYTEELEKVDSEIAVAVNHQEAETIIDKNLHKIDLLIRLGSANIEMLAHEEGSDNFRYATDVITQLIDYLQKLKEDGFFKEDPNRLDDLIKKLNESHNLSLGYYFFCTAFVYNQLRNPGIAAEYYEKAKIEFSKPFDSKYFVFGKLMAGYCAALKLFAEGLENFFSTNFSNAKFKFQRSYILLQELIETDLAAFAQAQTTGLENTKMQNQFKADYQTIKSYYYVSDAKFQFSNRNFKNASTQFASVVKEIHVILDNYSDALPDSIKALQQGDYYNYMGWKLLSEAELAREQLNWNIAFLNYEGVRKNWESASDSYLKSNMKQALTMQEIVLNQVLNIDTYQSQCDKEKQLNEKVSSLEKQIETLNERISNALKPAGVVINNNQEVVTTVEQNAQFIQNIEYKAKENIKEILAALKETPLDGPVKNQIEEAGNEILSTKEKGTKFFDKVKKFTKETAEIVKNVGEIAAPIAAGVKALSLLL